MSLSYENVVEANKTIIDALASAAVTTFNSSERLLNLNLQTARSLFESALAHSKSLAGAQDLNEALSISAALSQPLLEKTLAYSRNLYEISAQNQEQLVKLAEARRADFNQSVSTFLEKVSQSAPAGSEFASAAVKSAISAANSAFDTANRAAKQVAEITEASVAAATGATARALSNTTSAAKSARLKKDD